MSSVNMADFKGKKEQVLSLAKHEGLRWGTYAGVMSTMAVFTAQHYSTFFRTRTNVSARVALAISPPIAVYSFIAERTMSGAVIDPAKYGIYPPGHVMAVKQKKLETLHWYHKFANSMYSNPFAYIGALSAPVILGVYWNQTRKGHEHLNFQHKVLHTRVFGQMSFLAIILSVMFFKDYMYNNGGLFIQHDDGEVHREREEDA